MGFFSELLAEPAAQQAGRLSFEDVFKGGYVGTDIYDAMFAAKGFAPAASVNTAVDDSWAGQANYAKGESGEFGSDLTPKQAALDAYKGYTFDWTPGPKKSGELIGYDPEGNRVGAWQQKPEQSLMGGLLEWGALAAAGFGGLGLAGFGPLGGMLGGVLGGAADAGAGAVVADAGVAGGAAGAGTEIAGSGLTLGGSGTYGTITANAGALGAGGAGLGGGLTAPAFVAGAGEGLVGGLGMTAGAGAAASGGGISGLLSTIGGYLPAASQLASLASGVYGMKLAGDVREASDPFAPYRGAYAQQLAALEKNPGSIVTRPGFQAGLETIGRKSAASGYYGSGNMASALSRYSGDFYNQEATRLAGLAGAGQSPGAGQVAAADLASQSLGSIGYGLGPLLQRLTKGG